MTKIRLVFTSIYFLFTVIGFFISLDCNSQDSIYDGKYLLLTKMTSATGHQLRHLVYRKIKQDKDINIITKHSDTIDGRFSIISDSSILINGRHINLNEIKKIQANRGETESIIGLSTLVLFSGLIAFMETTNKPQEEDELALQNFYIREFIYGSIAFAGGIVAIIGLSDMTAFRYYNLDKSWILRISEKYKK